MSTTGIIGAMEEEVAVLKEKMKVESVIKKASMEFLKGFLGARPVVVVKCGIGKVNAGICAQILVDLFDVSAIINTGIAGSLRNEIEIGDIVISTDAVHHDMDVTELGYNVGRNPDFNFTPFKADTGLAELAAAICREVNPEIQVYLGRVASGDQFIADRLTKDRIISSFDACCTEMEGAAIAQAAYLNQIPYVIIRAISDKADNSATMDYPEFKAKAIIHSVNLVHQMVLRMP